VRVVPFCSTTSKLYPCVARVTVAGTESKAMADQIMTVSKERLGERQRILLPQELDGVDMAIRIQRGIAV